MALTPTLDEIIVAGLDAARAATWTCIPGKVLTYDAADVTVDVLPMVRSPIERVDGSTLNEDLPVIPNCPILWAQTNSIAITFPIQPGDFGLLLVLQYSASQYLDTGQVSDPGDLRPHHLGNAVFLPGFGPKTSKPQYAGDPDVVIEPGSAMVRLGGAATDFVALAAATNARLADLANAIATAAVTPGDGGAALKTNIAAKLATAGWSGSTPPSVAATKVKAK